MIPAFAFLVGMFVGAVALCGLLRIEMRRARGLSLFSGRQLVDALKGERR